MDYDILRYENMFKHPVGEYDKGLKPPSYHGCLNTRYDTIYDVWSIFKYIYDIWIHDTIYDSKKWSNNTRYISRFDNHDLGYVW